MRRLRKFFATSPFNYRFIWGVQLTMLAHRGTCMCHIWTSKIRGWGMRRLKWPYFPKHFNGVSSVNVDRKFGPSGCSDSIDRYQSHVSTSLLDDALLLSGSSWFSRFNHRRTTLKFYWAMWHFALVTVIKLSPLCYSFFFFLVTHETVVTLLNRQTTFFDASLPYSTSRIVL
mgnify:CR=1 FL=1